MTKSLVWITSHRALLFPIALVLVLFAAAIPLSSVEGQSMTPHEVSGSAHVLGSPAAQGTLVEAWSPLGKVAESRVDADGGYSLSIPVDTSTAGQPITFTVGGSMVGGLMADASVILTSGADATVDLDTDGCGRALPRRGTTATVSDILVSTCTSVARDSRYYARYFYFVLDRSAAIQIDMDDMGWFNDYFFLKDSTGRYSRSYLGSPVNTGALSVTLEPGVYVIEATSVSGGKTGRYTLTVSGLPRVTATPASPLAAPPHEVSGSAHVLGSPAAQGTLVEAWSPLGKVAESRVDADGGYSLSIPVDTSTAGQPITFTVGGSMVGGLMADASVILTSGADVTVDLDTDGCGRALPRRGTTATVSDILVSTCTSVARDSRYYARYFYFVLDRSAAIQIDMDDMGWFNDYFFLKDSTGRYSRSYLGSPVNTGALSVTLEPGVYVIEATSVSGGKTGRYTLTVSGLPRVTATPASPLAAPPHEVSGSAHVLGSPAAQGTLVEAWSPLGKVAESRVDADGGYSLSIPVDTSTAGQPITFTVGGSMVGGLMADASVILTSGADVTVDLDTDGCGRALPRRGTTATVSDILVSTCTSVARDSRYYARYFYFVLDRSAAIQIDMDDMGWFNDYFFLKDSTGRYSRSYLGSPVNTGALSVTLEPGVYVIEATSVSGGKTGRYTLTVSGLPRVTATPASPLAAPPHEVSGSAHVLGSPAAQGTLVEAWSPLGKVAESRVDADGGYSLSIPVDTSTAGQPITFTVGGSMVGGLMADASVILTSGADVTVDLDTDGCGRALPRQDNTATVSDILVSTCTSVARDSRYYARYFYFVLDRSAAIQIDMDDMGSFNDYFFLKDSTGRYSRSYLGSPVNTGALSVTLEPGVYVIEATSVSGGKTGRYTLTVSGLPMPAPPGAPAITTPITAGAGSLTVSWSAPSGNASGITAYDLRHILTSADETVDANWTVVDSAWTGAGPLQYTLTGLTDGAQYDVQVRAVNSVGDGTWSATATGTPALPMGATATRSFSPASVEPGGQVTVTITIANFGPAGIVTETLPQGFTYVSSTHGLVTHPVDGNSYKVRFVSFGETSFTYTVTAPSTEGTYTFSGTLTDSERNDHEVGGDTTVTVGDAPPGVTVTYAGRGSAAPVRIGTAIPVAATFTKTVTGFTVDDVTTGNGTVDNFLGSAAAYTFDVTPNAIGQVTVDIAANVAEDADGNGNTAAVRLQLGIPYDDNGDGAIEIDELFSAIDDYFAGVIGVGELFDIVDLYFSGPAPMPTA